MPPKSTTSTLVDRLNECLARCEVILTKLSSPTPTPAPAAADDKPPPALSAVRHDFISWSEFLAKSATELTLSLKPPISVAAAEGTAVKFADQLGNLTFCLEQLPVGGALTQEISWIAQELTESVQHLLAGSLILVQLPVASSSLKPAKAQRETNLRLTALVWDVNKRTTTLSTDELEASRKKWQTVLGLLDDCLEEVKEMEEAKEDGEEDEEEDEDDFSDDEFDEFRSSHPLSATERARVSAAHLLLRVGRLLVLRLLTTTKPDDSAKLPAKWHDAAFLTRVTGLAKDLSAAADDAAGTLEPPQDEDAVEVLLKDFANVARELEAAVSQGGGGEGEEEEEEGGKEGEWRSKWRKSLEEAEKKLDELSVEVEK